MMSRTGPGQRVTQGKSWNGRVQGDRGNAAMDVDTVRLLKTQDIGYVRTMRQVTRKEVARLEQQVVMTRGLHRLDDEDDDEDNEFDDDDDDIFDLPVKPKPARKIVFMDDEEERNEALDQGDEDADEDGDFEGLKDKPKGAEGEEDEQAQNFRRLRRELDNARRKLQVLTDAERQLEIQKAKMAKTATSGGETRRGHKIKVRTRKR